LRGALPSVSSAPSIISSSLSYDVDEVWLTGRAAINNDELEVADEAAGVMDGSGVASAGVVAAVLGTLFVVAD
jgi:hypothetical protein